MIYWVDLVSGDNSTGDGSYANPYKTMNYVLTFCTSDDEINVKETSAHTVITADCTFTNNSRYIETATDLTGSLSVGDYVGKPSAVGNGTVDGVLMERFGRIEAITSTRITWECYYYGLTETVSSILKVNIATNDQTNVSIIWSTRNVDRITFRGGYDTETTQNGETWVKPNGSMTTYNGIDAQAAGQLQYCNIDRLNMVECNYIKDSTVYSTNFTNCFLWSYRAPWVSGNSSVPTTATNCIIASEGAQGYFMYGLKYDIIDSIIIGDKGTYILMGVSHYGQRFIRSKIYAMSAGIRGWSPNSPYGHYFEDLEIYYCTVGLNVGSVPLLIDGIKFYNCADGVKTAAGADGLIVQNCEFHDCTGDDINLLQAANVMCINNIHRNSNDCIQTDVYCGGIKAINCDFGNPSSYAFEAALQTLGNEVIDCSIDAGYENKLIYDPNLTRDASEPRYILSGTNADYYFAEGSYYPKYSVVKSTNVHSSYPSLKIQMKSTYTHLEKDGKVFSTYVKVGTGKKISFYYKMDSGWVGTIQFKARNNGLLIRDFTSATITTGSLNWVKVELTVLDSDVVKEGELSLGIVPNGNTIPWYLDDFTIEDV